METPSARETKAGVRTKIDQVDSSPPGFPIDESRRAMRSDSNASEEPPSSEDKLVISTRRKGRGGETSAASRVHVRVDQLMDIRPNSCVRSSGSGVAINGEGGLRGGGREGSMVRAGAALCASLTPN